MMGNQNTTSASASRSSWLLGLLQPRRRCACEYLTMLAAQLCLSAARSFTTIGAIQPTQLLLWAAALVCTQSQPKLLRVVVFGSYPFRLGWLICMVAEQYFNCQLCRNIIYDSLFHSKFIANAKIASGLSPPRRCLSKSLFYTSSCG